MSQDRVVTHSFAKALPSRLVTNDDLAQLLDTSDEWIQKRTGIKTRYWAEPPTTTSDLAAESARNSFRISGRDHCDCIVAATLSPDFCFPGIGVLTQAKLELPPIPAYDVRNQCSGFLYALEMAGSLVSQGKYERVLVIGAEVHSTGLDISTRGRDLAVLFGDGAGSCLVERQSGCRSGHQGSGDSTLGLELLDSRLLSDGRFVRELWCEHPGSAHFPTRLTREMIDEAQVFPQMNGRRVFEHAVKSMVQVSMEILNGNQLTNKDVSLLVPHQANIRINEMVAHELSIPPERVWNTIEKYGNTTAATIPIGLAEAFEAGMIQEDANVLCPAFGSGFTWGAALLRGVRC